MLRRYRILLPLLPAIIFSVIFFCYPLIRIFALSVDGYKFDFVSYAEIFKTTLYLKVIVNTLLISTLITFLCLVLGYPVAYLLSTTTKKKRNILILFVILPLWTSLLVRTYAWMVILQQSGMGGQVNQFLLKAGIIDEPLTYMYNLFSVSVAMTHVLLPLMILTLYAVMRSINIEILLISRNLGANRFRTFFKIYLPLTLPGIIAGSFIVFMMALGYFITPALIGGRRQTMIAMLIDNQINYLLNWSFGAALSVILLIVVTIIYIVFNRSFGLDKIWGGLR